MFDTFSTSPSSVASDSETAGEIGFIPFMLGGCWKYAKRTLTALSPANLSSSMTSDGKLYPKPAEFPFMGSSSLLILPVLCSLLTINL
jgi:hypothetical protein